MIVIPSRRRVRKGFASGLKDLPAANQSVVAETILWRLRNPSFVSSPNSIAEEMQLGAEDTVEIDGDRHVAIGGSELGRNESSSG